MYFFFFFFYMNQHSVKLCAISQYFFFFNFGHHFHAGIKKKWIKNWVLFIICFVFIECKEKVQLFPLVEIAAPLAVWRERWLWNMCPICVRLQLVDFQLDPDVICILQYSSAIQSAWIFYFFSLSLLWFWFFEMGEAFRVDAKLMCHPKWPDESLFLLSLCIRYLLQLFRYD